MSSALLIGIPGVRFFFSGIRSGNQPKPDARRVARLSDLPEGKPVQVSVIGNRRDAWTVYPDEVIGRVWLIRAAGNNASEEIPIVTALTSVCPHLGCAVQLDAKRKHFVCPCHRAAFGLSGARLAGKDHPSHAPRDLDSLDCQLVRDEAADDWWVEVIYQQFEQGRTTKVCKA
jgi:Rieske Fe-S protein